jgi:glycosyltransferase involved in cell wall biosynthesis
MRILFLAPYPADESPSQRYRLEHYLSLLPAQGIKYDYKPFLSKAAWKIIFQPGNNFRKINGILAGFCKRFFQLFLIGRYDFVYIHREATPAGPPFFEWVASRIFRKKIIYDFDDAIWIPFTSNYNKGASRLKSFGKVAKICRWSFKVSVGNEYLAAFARQYNSNVIEIPTVVNTETVHNKLQDQQTNSPAIGWTGTFSTLKYLDMVLPVLQELQETHSFSFVVIADKDPALHLRNYRFIKWNKDTESEDLLNFHIGLMPLHDDDISKGKCGFKAIQYMSLGIPAVVSPVGVNTKIVNDSINGFVCASPGEWKKKMNDLLTNTDLRISLGKAAREKIQKKYSVKSTEQLFLDLFN